VNHVKASPPQPDRSVTFPFRPLLDAGKASRWLLRILLLSGLLLPEILLRSGFFSRHYPAFWLERAYPALVGFWSALTGFFPFSVTLWLVAPLLVLSALLALVSARRAGWPRALYRLALLLCIVNAWHTLNWGLNYAREPLRYGLGLSGEVSAEMNVELFRYLASVLHETELASPDAAVALAASVASLNELSAGLGLAANLQPSVRSAPAGLLLLGGVSGFISPLTLEPHLDAALALYQRVSIGIHELAHIAGVAHEGDATLLAAIAGLRASDPFVRYSTALLHIYQIPLPRELRDELLQLVPLSARQERSTASVSHSELRSDWFSAFQGKVLDAYLRWQGAADGIADYSNGTRQLAQAYRMGWF
jgi:hypothetical protein